MQSRGLDRSRPLAFSGVVWQTWQSRFPLYATSKSDLFPYLTGGASRSLRADAVQAAPGEAAEEEGTSRSLGVRSLRRRRPRRNIALIGSLGFTVARPQCSS